MADFNTIYAAVTPYLGTSGIALVIIGLLYVFVKYRSTIKKFEKEIKDFVAKIKCDFENTESEALKVFKQALPSDFAINIETLTRQEIASIKEYFITAINENWLKQITNNNELMLAMAHALLSIKSISDTDKKAIAEIINATNVETTDKLKIDLLPVSEEIEEPKKEVKRSEKILID
jgi:hypothetical protein